MRAYFAKMLSSLLLAIEFHFQVQSLKLRNKAG